MDDDNAQADNIGRRRKAPVNKEYFFFSGA
jgi:hypothetical protein